MITYLIPKYPKWKLIIKIVRVTAFVHLLYEDVKCLVLGILIVEVSNEIQFSYPKVDHWSGLFYLYRVVYTVEVVVCLAGAGEAQLC